MMPTPSAEDREAFLRQLADVAWETRDRGMFDKALELARAMGKSDGTNEACTAVNIVLAGRAA